MTRPRATIGGVLALDGLDLPTLPDVPYDLTGLTVTGEVRDRTSGDAALDAVMRGAALVVRVELPDPLRAEFLDQLARIADVDEGVPNVAEPPRAVPGSEHYALLRELHGGATLHQAARTVGVSRRTAARRLSELRTFHRVGTVAELLTTVDL